VTEDVTVSSSMSLTSALRFFGGKKNVEHRYRYGSMRTQRTGLVFGAVVAVSALLETGCSDDAAGVANPIERDGDYVLEFKDLYFAVNPAGARITDVHLQGGTNLLTGASVNPIDYGSTFWTSPQSAWSWPPPAEIDSAAYAPTVDPPRISFVGATDVLLGASVSKRFTANVAKSLIVADYDITAQGRDQMVAPWEVTRVFPGGLTFYPTGTGAPTAGGGFTLPPTQDAAGCTWYQHPGVAPGVDQKLLADGSGGWLAQVAGDIVIVKKFADIGADMAAPGEAEIEIFVQGQGAYVEVEQQGAYQALTQGQHLTWRVTWIIQRLPAGMAATVGSVELVQFVQNLVQESG
jgi:hypothetical protein